MLANKEFLVRTGIVLPAGTTSQAPLTLKQGSLLSSVNSGSLEWDGFNLFITENKSDKTSFGGLGIDGGFGNEGGAPKLIFWLADISNWGCCRFGKLIT